MKYSDLIEHELKFEIHSNDDIDKILSLFSSYGDIEFFECRNQVDRYFDTNDFVLYKYGYTYKYRVIEESTSRINFKFPGSYSNGRFVRRELRNKFKNPISCSPVLIECETNKYLTSFLNKYALDKFDLTNKLTVFTKRKSYLFYDEKDICSNKRTYGVMYFDECSKKGFDCPADLLEFEFELWNGGLCESNINLQKKICDELIRMGYTGSRMNKYTFFINRDGMR